MCEGVCVRENDEVICSGQKPPEGDKETKLEPIHQRICSSCMRLGVCVFLQFSLMLHPVIKPEKKCAFLL